MADKSAIAVIPYQGKIQIDTVEGQVYITQSNEHGEPDDAILVAAENIDRLIDALKLAKDEIQSDQA